MPKIQTYVNNNVYEQITDLVTIRETGRHRRSIAFQCIFYAAGTGPARLYDSAGKERGALIRWSTTNSCWKMFRGYELCVQKFLK